MTFKQFLRPTIGKISLAIILVFLFVPFINYSSVLCPVGACTPGEYCPPCPYSTSSPGILFIKQ